MGLWSRSLSIARVEPQDEVTKQQSLQSFLAMRWAVRLSDTDQALWAITVTNGPGCSLTEASGWDITGGSPIPRRWRLSAGACRTEW